jgi:chromosome segregation ATPase
MTDEPENLVLALLREIRAEQEAMRTAQERMQAGITEIKLAVAANGAEIGIVRKDVEGIKKSINILEGDMRTIRMRVERIEDHIGLVKA